VGDAGRYGFRTIKTVTYSIPTGVTESPWRASPQPWSR
jgi:protocatechuate 3,4-dioxygenase beta subunit